MHRLELVSPRCAPVPRLGSDAATLGRAFAEKLSFNEAKFPALATRHDCAQALSGVVRDRVLERWLASAQRYFLEAHRTVAYLSAEYLLGPQLGSNLLALGLEPAARAAMRAAGLDLDNLLDAEEDPGLGNGGLGRLAACFMDSLATLQIPAIGYGIRYEFGIFDQAIRAGWQVEHADTWLRLGNPWEIPRVEVNYDVGFGGHTRPGRDGEGHYRVTWSPERHVRGFPVDIPIVGYGCDNANFLRLWQATSAHTFDFHAFDAGEYFKAVERKVASENLTKVLYPNDASLAGKQLRLEQQYFFVSCTLQDLIRLALQRGVPVERFHEKYAVQLNDTHPSLAVAELMRLLVDVHGLPWETAWDCTVRAVGYTNHTLMPEALEAWPLALFERVLPRHLEIVREIDRRFAREVSAAFPDDPERVARMAIVGGERVRMAHLATVGAHHINGVADLHGRLLKETVLKDFAELWPERFTSVTNGVTPRRFVALCNPGLTRLVSDRIGADWIRDLDGIAALEPAAEDAGFRQAWRDVKRANKAALATHLAHQHALPFDPEWMLDVQVKRIHEYKRQLLNALHVVWRWLKIRDGWTPAAPRTVLFGGKAAPGYLKAKLVIRLIHAISDAIAADPRARDWLKVVFVPDFNVKSAQWIYPAADLSEQISTAGMEASGTGNMKLSLNGALTIGTLDGANVEIRDAVGPDRFFLFGLTAHAVQRRKADGYRPLDVVSHDPELAAVLAALASLVPGEPELFLPLLRDLRTTDPFLVLADFRDYVRTQSLVDAAFVAGDDWARQSVVTVARMGRFSSDRAIREYATRIWNVEPVPVALPPVGGTP